MFKLYILVLSTAIQLNLDVKPNDPYVKQFFLIKHPPMLIVLV